MSHEIIYSLFCFCFIDLAMTNVSNGDHVVFRYEEVDGEKDPVNVGAPSAGQHIILLYAVMLLTTVMPLI